MSPELDKELCVRYPEIFQKRNLTIQESCMAWGFSHGDGWYNLINKLCEQITNYHKYHTDVPQTIAEQVKYKFGGLRFYIQGGDKFIRGLIRMAESMSYSICDKCGNTLSPDVKCLCETDTKSNTIHYVAMAYRYGQVNDDQYIVSASSDQELIGKLARNEWQNRGGKYSIVIYACDSNNEAESSKLIEYIPSSVEHINTNGPRINFHKEAAEDIGRDIIEAFEKGTVLMPDKKQSTEANTIVLSPQKVSLPKWLQEKVKYQTKLADELEAHVEQLLHEEGTQ